MSLGLPEVSTGAHIGSGLTRKSHSCSSKARHGARGRSRGCRRRRGAGRLSIGQDLHLKGLHVGIWYIQLGLEGGAMS